MFHVRELGVRVTLTRTGWGEVREADDLGELDARLAALCRERGPLRVVAARIASSVVLARSWERLGYARLSDYAAERLGVSSRSVQSLAQVGHRLRWSPRLEAALASGELGWTKARLLAPLPPTEDLAHWIGFARRVTATQLAKAVRAVDGASIEGGALEEDARGRLFEVRCSPEVRRKWEAAVTAARRVAGGRVPVAEAAELIAAEVLSALPLDEGAEGEGCEGGDAPRAEASETSGVEAAGEGARCLPWRGGAAKTPEPPRPVLSPALESLVDGLDDADAFELDARLRCALSLEQRLEARLGPWLLRAWRRPVPRALGFASRESYARERLGMDPTRARALVRLERTLGGHPALARAYRSGALSWVKASALAPLADAECACLDVWVSWAGRVSVRRLRDDVERALTLEETDPEVFHSEGGLPVDAQREISATHKDAEGNHTETSQESFVPFASSEPAQDREIGATQRVWVMGRWHHGPPGSAPDETCFLRFVASAEVVCA